MGELQPGQAHLLLCLASRVRGMSGDEPCREVEGVLLCAPSQGVRAPHLPDLSLPVVF